MKAAAGRLGDARTTLGQHVNGGGDRNRTRMPLRAAVFKTAALPIMRPLRTTSKVMITYASAPLNFGTAAFRERRHLSTFLAGRVPILIVAARLVKMIHENTGNEAESFVRAVSGDFVDRSVQGRKGARK